MDLKKFLFFLILSFVVFGFLFFCDFVATNYRILERFSFYIYNPLGIFTYWFIHGNFLHFYSNFLILLFFGFLSLEYFDSKRFFLFFLSQLFFPVFFSSLIYLFFFNTLAVLFGASTLAYGFLSFFLFKNPKKGLVFLLFVFFLFYLTSPLFTELVKKKEVEIIKKERTISQNETSIKKDLEKIKKIEPKTEEEKKVVEERKKILEKKIEEIKKEKKKIEEKKISIKIRKESLIGTIPHLLSVFISFAFAFSRRKS